MKGSRLILTIAVISVLALAVGSFSLVTAIQIAHADKCIGQFCTIDKSKVKCKFKENFGVIVCG